MQKGKSKSRVSITFKGEQGTLKEGSGVIFNIAKTKNQKYSFWTFIKTNNKKNHILVGGPSITKTTFEIIPDYQK